MFFRGFIEDEIKSSLRYFMIPAQWAGGFWIERGERAFPVSEITISANFDDLWKRIDGLGDDLDTRSSVQVPTIRVSQMTVAGT